MRSEAMKRVPYLIHTNLEFGLMLRGVKPLAMFADDDERTSECLRRYLRMFDRHADSGRFVKREHAVDAGDYRFRYILYALQGEEWRIEAMVRLKESPGWSADHEREEGRLLGYEDWMNDLWLARLEERE